MFYATVQCQKRRISKDSCELIFQVVILLRITSALYERFVGVYKNLQINFLLNSRILCIILAETLMNETRP